MILIDKIRRSLCDKRMKRIVDISKKIYQVQEVNGELWLTFQGQAIVPASLLCKDILNVLDELRAKYVENHDEILQ